MNIKNWPATIYMAVVGLLVFFIFLTPVLAMQGNKTSDVLYDDVFAYMCHQKLSRSYCLFDDYSIKDCTTQNGEYRNDLRSEKMALIGGIGYKFPVSARDMAIYIGMLIGGLWLVANGKLDSIYVPAAIWFILALVPIGIDGVSQTIFGIRESINLIRAITGFIAGFAVSVYGIPLINFYLNSKKRGR